MTYKAKTLIIVKECFTFIKRLRYNSLMAILPTFEGLKNDLPGQKREYYLPGNKVWR